MLGNIQIYEPRRILKNYIAYYYELPLKDNSYYAYPHYNLPVSIIGNSKVTLVNDIVKIEQTDITDLCSFTVNKFTKPLKILVNGSINDFCIVFKPYGLSQFLDSPLNLSSRNNLFIIELFRDLSEYIPNFSKLETIAKIKLLEDYLLSKLQIIEDNEIILKTFDLFFKEQKISIDKIAALHNYHPKKLYRLFKNICGESPLMFKKIVQFRKALEKIKDMKDQNLTNIALDSNYFDQPAFNNAFKNLTGEKPSSFFKDVEDNSEKSIYFKNVKKS